MPAAIGSQLNKLVSAAVSPAETAAGLSFAVVNLDATYGSGYLVDGIDFSLRFNNLADAANVFIISLTINKNVVLNGNTSLASQVGQAEVLWGKSGEVTTQRSLTRLFIPPFQLPQGAPYAIVGDYGLNPPPAGSVGMHIVVTGRPMPGGYAPIQLR